MEHAVTENRSFKMELQQRTVFAQEKQKKQVGRYVVKNMRRWLKQMQDAADCQRTETTLKVDFGFWDALFIDRQAGFESEVLKVLHGAITHLGFSATIRTDGVLVQWNDFR